MENQITYARSGQSSFPVWFYDGLFYSTADREILMMIDAGVFNFQTQHPDDKWIKGMMHHQAVANMAIHYLEVDDAGLVHWTDVKRDLRILWARWQNQW